jgi:tRNA (guanine-N7-)-methyltransferase
VVELIPESYVAHLDLDAIFGRRAPVQVDLGCGDGSFLALVAREQPECNFLGIERMAGRVRTSSRKALDLPNVRVLRVETSYAVRYLLPPSSTAIFHLLFPDPWPKRRHQRRRVVTSEFLDDIAHALVDEGAARVVTDQLEYFEQIRALAEKSPALQVGQPHRRDNFPPSTFERNFVAAGAPIYRLELRKVSPVR